MKIFEAYKQIEAISFLCDDMFQIRYSYIAGWYAVVILIFLSFIGSLPRIPYSNMVGNLIDLFFHCAFVFMAV